MVTLAAAGLAACDPQTSTPDHSVQDSGAEFFLINTSLRFHDELGQLTQEMTTHKMVQDSNDQSTRVEDSQIRIHSKQGAAWQIIAPHGRISADGKTVELRKQVVLTRPADSGHPPVRIETPSLTILPAKQYASTEDTIRVESHSNWITATGMQAWFGKQNRIKFLSKVRGYYHVP